MKKTRRFAAMVAAMALAATMVAPTMMNAGAEGETGETSEITNPVKVVTDGTMPNEVTTITPDADNAAHTYTAYQILKGTWTLKEGKAAYSTDDNDYELKVTDLGTAANTLLSDNAFKAFKADDYFGKSIGEVISALGNDATDPQKAAALAQFLSDVQTNTPKAEELAEIIGNALKDAEGVTKTKIEADTTLAEGYYLVTDSYTPNADSPTNNKPDAISKFILKVNGTMSSAGIKIIPKKSYPEVIKKVQENAKDVESYETTPTAIQAAATTGAKWNDVADYNIGDDVPFRLCGSMPETLADYDAYYYKFTDTLDTQFDQPKTVTVTVGTNAPLIFTLNQDGTKYELPAGKYLEKNETAIPAGIHTELVATPKFMEQINEALVDVEGWGSMDDQAKLEYVRDHWDDLTAAATETTVLAGALVAKGYTSDKNVTDYIKEKTIIDTPAVPVRDKDDTTTDGNCRVTWDSTNHKLLVSFENVKAYTGVTSSTIVTVEYNAKLNATADIGLDGQENKVDLTYSHNPNTDYNPVTNDDQPEAPTDENTDTTPEDKVVVFTYEVDINKIDADTKQNLKGAEFQLKSGSTAIKFIDNGDGTYTVADQTLETGTTTTIKSDKDGLFKLVGLDDGEYTLTETKAPEGYPTPEGDAANFKLELTATTVNNQAWSSTASDALTAIAGTLAGKSMDILSAGTVTRNNNTRGANGGVAGVIQNSKSTTLPSTGGMGTKLFIAGGGITATLAAAYLVSKKRSRKEEE